MDEYHQPRKYPNCTSTPWVYTVHRAIYCAFAPCARDLSVNTLCLSPSLVVWGDTRKISQWRNQRAAQTAGQTTCNGEFKWHLRDHPSITAVYSFFSQCKGPTSLHCICTGPHFSCEKPSGCLSLAQSDSIIVPYTKITTRIAPCLSLDSLLGCGHRPC